MCGITGIYAFNEIGRFHIINLQKSTDILKHRGPDTQGTYLQYYVGLGHRRLSVIDLSNEANQPMSDKTGRYWIVYNGEIYNYKILREELIQKGIIFSTQSDTEVLLNLFIHDGIDGVRKLNGFFAFAIYDQQTEELIIVRDRYGIKPLYYYLDEDKIIFASELRSILAFGIQKLINPHALNFFFQLNYIPAPLSIINGVHKLLPGNAIQIKNKQVFIRSWYNLPAVDRDVSLKNKPELKTQIRSLLEKSVSRRLVSDVPLGTFLSGGLDSSIITALASRIKPDLNTFSIGFSDNSFFDETRYSRLIARYFKTNHTQILLTEKDMFDHLFSLLDHLDEPFADSSALPVYILSKETRKHVTVALSGDGADELFGGYYKHQAFYRALYPGITEHLTYYSRFIWSILPRSRNDFISNKFRQLKRFTDGFRLSPDERYWRWLSLNSEKNVSRLLNPDFLENLTPEFSTAMKHEWVGNLSADLDSILTADFRFLLPNDMLYKVDSMSMAHGLEVRVPFLDHDLVEYVNAIPAKMKMPHGEKKALLKETFSDIIPAKILHRRKKGFEVPLLRWMRTGLDSLINDRLLNDSFIMEQGIFNKQEIKTYKNRLKSSSPGDVHAHLWALIVFQWWWKKYIQ